MVLLGWSSCGKAGTLCAWVGLIGEFVRSGPNNNLAFIAEPEPELLSTRTPQFDENLAHGGSSDPDLRPGCLNTWMGSDVLAHLEGSGVSGMEVGEKGREEEGWGGGGGRKGRGLGGEGRREGAKGREGRGMEGGGSGAGRRRGEVGEEGRGGRRGGAVEEVRGGVGEGREEEGGEGGGGRGGRVGEGGAGTGAGVSCVIRTTCRNFQTCSTCASRYRRIQGRSSPEQHGSKFSGERERQR